MSSKLNAKWLVITIFLIEYQYQLVTLVLALISLSAPKFPLFTVDFIDFKVKFS